MSETPATRRPRPRDRSVLSEVRERIEEWLERLFPAPEPEPEPIRVRVRR
jgi:hypothetical protein